MNPIRPLVIIGAGAAGLMAAITAARKGEKVLLLEKNNHAGLKILTTGDGKGNLTNSNLETNHYHSHDPTFFTSALKIFGFQETWNFFGELGIKLSIADNGRVFPYSREASVIQKALVLESQQLKIELLPGIRIQEIIRIGSHFEIRMKDSPSEYVRKMILSTGGMAAPLLGTTGDGYQWVSKLGHHIESLFPSLVQLTTHFTGSYLLNKVKVTDAIINLLVEEKVIENRRGEVLFIPRGVSGSAVFALSRMASEAIYQEKKVTLQINFVPNFSLTDLIDFFQDRKRIQPKQPLILLVEGILPEKLSYFILNILGIPVHMPVGSLPEDKLVDLMHLITCFSIPVTGTKSWKYAQVTCGGVSVGEVNPKTMESKIIPNLYFAGEILDVDGDCGGYNLQWAWSSGYVAGQSASVPGKGVGF